MQPKRLWRGIWELPRYACSRPQGPVCRTELTAAEASSGRPEFDGPLTKKCSPCEEPERCHTGRKRRSATFDYPAPILHTSCLTVASELWRTRKARDRSAVGVATLGCHYAVVLEKLPPQQIATASARPLRVAYFVDAEDCSDACLDAVFAETYKHAC